MWKRQENEPYGIPILILWKLKEFLSVITSMYHYNHHHHQTTICMSTICHLMFISLTYIRKYVDFLLSCTSVIQYGHTRFRSSYQHVGDLHFAVSIGLVSLSIWRRWFLLLHPFASCYFWAMASENPHFPLTFRDSIFWGYTQHSSVYFAKSMFEFCNL